MDSHVHLDRIFAEHPARITWLKDVGCHPISWAFGEGIKSVSDLRGYLRAKSDTVHQIYQSSLPCFYLAGIHPRNITPDLRPEDIEDILEPYLEDDLCLGIGEIGLETGHNHEKEIFSAQLSMAQQVTQRGKVFGVHTPRENKVHVTREVLALLEGFREYHTSLVVDHCTVETISQVLDMAFWAGVTLSPIKTSFQELDEIVKITLGYMDRIMLNTDSGNFFYEDLYRFCRCPNIPNPLKMQLTKQNALEFFREASGKK